MDQKLLNGSGQNLLSSVGSCSTGGTMYYYSSNPTTSSTAPEFSTSTWTTTAPTRTDAGTTTVYVYAKNGLAKAVKVTVK